MPKLSDYWENFEEYTGKASDVARQLSFAGIALLWLLREPGPDQLTVPEELIPTLALFVLSLSFDLLQYVVASVVWGSFCRFHEARLKQPEDNPVLTGPRWINWPANFFFIGRLVLVVIAYALLLTYCGVRIVSS